MKKGQKLFVLVLVVVALCLAFIACKPKEQEIPEGPETGVYYNDAGGINATIKLYGGNKFEFKENDTARTGEYTLVSEALTLTFTSTNDTAISATYKDRTISIGTRRFLEQIYFTVTYNSQSGSDVASALALNGKTVPRPINPTRAGYHFINWHTEPVATLENVFSFSTTPIVKDITLYARWVAESTNPAAEFSITLNHNYTGAPTPTVVKTVEHKLYEFPVLDSQNGYEFKDWWVSHYEDGAKLAYPAAVGMEFEENATLYAFWQKPAIAPKLNTPIPRVDGDFVRWEGVGTSSYKLVVKGSADSGFTKIDEEVNLTYKNIGFSTISAGDYEIEVTALATVSDNNSATAKIYFRNRGLAKVTHFEVEEPSVLKFTKVKNAAKYLIKVECGDSTHNHNNTPHDNADSNVFDFSDCPMPESGINFTVIARATNYADSVSEAWNYDRRLQEVSVSSFIYDEDTQILSWNSVLHATSYVVSVICGDINHNHTNQDIGNKRSYDLKYCAFGDVQVFVTPKANNYNSPAASVYNFHKETLATPRNIGLNGNKITWTEVDGAVSYSITISGVEYTSNTNEFVITDDINIAPESDNPIIIIAMGAGGKTDPMNSLQSNVFPLRTSMKNIYYEPINGFLYNVVSWDFVLGTEIYQIKLNDGDWIDVEATVNYYEIALDKPEKNVIQARSFAKNVFSQPVSIEVFAYTITFVTNGDTPDIELYVKDGDKITLPSDVEYTGYSFANWYTLPQGGTVYTATIFKGESNIEVYAHWTPKKYVITFDYKDGRQTGGTAGEATFTERYKFDTPENKLNANGTVMDDGTIFVGWYTSVDVINGILHLGVRLTDEHGNCYGNRAWNIASDTTVYAFWANVLTYTKSSDGTYRVAKGPYITYVSDVKVPATYLGATISTIDGYGFYNLPTLINLSIPNTISTISSVSPFDSSPNLTNVHVYEVEGNLDIKYLSDNGVLFRDDSAGGETKVTMFFFPKGKKGEYIVPGFVTNIGSNLFAGSLLTKITIPNTVTRIEAKAFQNSPELDAIIFEEGYPIVNGKEVPNTLSIGDNAFANCYKLTEITIIARAVDFNISIFTNSNIGYVYVAKGNPDFSDRNGVLYNKDGDTLLYFPRGRSGPFTIPDFTTYIGADAFRSHTKLTKLTISSDVISIGPTAFYMVSSLTSVVFEARDGDLSIGKQAFYQCSRLEAITFEDGCNVVEIGESAFYGCINLSEIELPSTLTKINQFVFQHCRGLTSVTFPDTLIEIDNSAFASCIKLEALTIPGSIERIGNLAFSDCKGIEDVEFESGDVPLVLGTSVFQNCSALTVITIPGRVIAPSNVTTDAARKTHFATLFVGCKNLFAINVEKDEDGLSLNAYLNSDQGVLFDKNITTAIYYPMGKTDQFTIPKTMTVIGSGLFQNFTNLVSVHIPKTVIEIGTNAFNGSGLQTITFEKGEEGEVLPELRLSTSNATTGAPNLTAGSAFMGSALTSIEIPARVVNLNTNTFQNCVGLTTITFEEGSQLRTIGANAFKGSAITSIEIPAGVISFGYNTSTTLLTADERDGGSYGLNAFENCTDLAEVSFAEGSRLRIIGDSVFAGTTALSGIVLPDTVKAIGNSSFKGSGIESINIPKSVIAIGTSAFDSCNNLGEVTFEAGEEGETLPGLALNASVSATIATTGTSAFLNCTSLTSIEIPARTTGIGTTIFSGCTNLGTVSFGYENATAESKGTSRLASISTDAFLNCKSLTGIELPSVTSIGNTAFKNTGLTSIEIPDSVGTVGTNAFEGCAGLQTVKFPNNTNFKTIQTSLFLNCTKLIGSSTGLIIPNTVTTINANAFQNCAALQKITLPTNADFKIISGNVFYGTASLGDLTLPNSVTTINSGAFTNSGVTSLNIPAALTTITNLGTSTAFTTFQGATRLTGFNVHKDNPKYMDIGGVLFNKDATNPELSGTTLLLYPGGKPGAYKIPKKVTTIGNYAFHSTAGLTNLTFEEGEEEEVLEGLNIGINYATSATAPTSTYVFQNSGMLTIVLPARLSYLGAYAFNGAAMLNSLKFDPDTTIETLHNGTFQNCRSLTTIEIPASVKYFGSGVTLNETTNVLSGPTQVFLFGIGLKTVTFAEGSNLKLIGNQVFGNGGNTSLASTIESIEFPKSVTNIGTGLFYFCPRLETVSFEEGSLLTTLGTDAFYKNFSLKSLTIPKNLKYSSGTTAFNLVSSLALLNSLEEINIEDGHPDYISKDGVVFSSDEKTLVAYPTAKGPKYDVPKGTEVIGENAFNVRRTFTDLNKNSAGEIPSTALTEVWIPNTVRLISNGAFKNTAGLKKITFEKEGEVKNNLAFGTSDNKTTTYSVFKGSGLTAIEIPARTTYINDFAFAQAGNTDNSNFIVRELKTVTFEANSRLTAIPANAFMCNILEGDLVIPNGVLSIGDRAFSGASSQDVFENNTLRSVTLPNTVVSIGQYAFSGNIALSQVRMPVNAAFTSISSYLFYGCTSLTSIEIPRAVTSIGTYAFVNTGITSINLPAGLESIGNYAFWGSKLSGNLELPANLSTIGTYAFYGTNITEVNIPAGVTIIQTSLFENCRNLKTVHLFDSVLTINGNAFKNCVELENITLPTNLTTLQYGAFENCQKLPHLTIHSRIATMPSNAFTGIASYDEILIEPNQTNFIVDEYGVLFNYAKTTLIAYPAGKVGPYNIPIGVTTIAQYAFAGAVGLTEVYIPEGLETISQYAFAASSITKVNIPSSVRQVNSFAFTNCQQLVDLNLEERMGNLSGTTLVYDFINGGNNESVFAGTTALRHVKWPNRVSIGSNTFNGSGIASIDFTEVVTFGNTSNSFYTGAFANTPNLKTFVWPSQITSIGNEMFYNSGLENITLPRGVTTLQSGSYSYDVNGAFGACMNLKTITLPDTVTSIGSDCFKGSGLVSIIIPASVTSIGARVFANCADLTTVTFKEGSGTVSLSGAGTFANCTSLVEINLTRTSSLGSTTAGQQGTFEGCINLERVRFTLNVSSLSENTFRGCTKLISITMPSCTVSYFAVGLFAGCESLVGFITATAITLPAALTRIRANAFEGCISINSIIIPSSFVAGTSTSYGIEDSVFAGWTSSQSIYMQGIKESDVAYSLTLSTSWSVGWLSNCEAQIFWNWTPEAIG